MLGRLVGGADRGRLQAMFSTRMAFGKRVAFASREALRRFKRQYYRPTTQLESTTKTADLCSACRVQPRRRVLRTTLQLAQPAFAAQVGAAIKAVIYQWESRRRPSPVPWARVRRLSCSQL
jgi:DNA-binding transcriptional regulator YiaG